ncbi:MAG: heparinase II/III family protein, partial [Bullifex sp.]
PMYQCEVLHSFLDTIVIADRNSVKVPEALRDKTHLMASSLKNLISASGNMFMTGDTDEINPSALLTLASHIFMDEKLASGVHEENCWDGVSPYGNRMPERKSAFMESDGHMILRGSGIEAHMFTGNMGSGHGHVSQLHLDISGRNRNFFIDPGRYTYTDCEKRLLYKSAAMHNIPMTSSDYTLKPIGSWSYNEIGETTRGRHASAAGYEVMEAENLSFIRDGLMIRRKVLKLTDEIITVIDEYFSSEYVKAVIPFHAHPDCTMHMEEGMIRLESHDETMYLLTDGNAEVGTSTVSLHYNEESDSGLVTVSKDVGKTGSVITVLSRKPVTMKHLETELIDAHRILGKSEAVSFTVSDGEHEWTVISRPAETVAQVDIIRSGSCEGYGRLIVKEKSAASATTLFF